MTTKKQAAANKRNAKKSTGPRTSEGKAKSARNAMKLGVLMRPVTAPHEDLEEFLQLQRALMEEFKPDTYVTRLLVKRLAMLFWREHRLADAEAREFRLSEFDALQAEAAGEEATEKAMELVTREDKRGIDFDMESELLRHYKEASLGALRQSTLVIPLERQLLIGRYQTMLSNQIAQTYRQLEAELERNMRVIEAEPRHDPANDTDDTSPDVAGEHPAKK